MPAQSVFKQNLPSHLFAANVFQRFPRNKKCQQTAEKTICLVSVLLPLQPPVGWISVSASTKKIHEGNYVFHGKLMMDAQAYPPYDSYQALSRRSISSAACFSASRRFEARARVVLAEIATRHSTVNWCAWASPSTSTTSYCGSGFWRDCSSSCNRVLASFAGLSSVSSSRRAAYQVKTCFLHVSKPLSV